MGVPGAHCSWTRADGPSRCCRGAATVRVVGGHRRRVNVQGSGGSSASTCRSYSTRAWPTWT